MQQGKGKPEQGDNDILRRRKQLARRRRRALLRLLIVSVILLVFLAVLLFIGYKVVSCGLDAYQAYQTRYSAYQQRQESWRGDVDPAFAGYTNILVMGIDEGADAIGAGEKRADAIFVLSLDNRTGAVRCLNIPADTWVTVAGTTAQNKLKNIYEMGGAPLMTRELNQLLGISLHQYVAIDMPACAQLIDALGGIDFYVEKDMDYDDPAGDAAIHLQQGYQHLTGAQAVAYLRFRSDDLGDIGRVERQRRFLEALYGKVVSLDTVPKLPQIAQILRTRVDMSAEIFDAAHLANVLRHLQTQEPESILLPGKPSPYDETIFLPDAAGIQAQMQAWFPADSGNAEEETTKDNAEEATNEGSN